MKNNWVIAITILEPERVEILITHGATMGFAIEYSLTAKQLNKQEMITLDVKSGQGRF